MNYSRHNSTWGWLIALFVLIAVVQAYTQEREAKPIEILPLVVSTETITAVSAPIDVSGDNPCSRNALLLIRKFGTVAIPPGHVWSFNDATGNPNLLPYETCMGTPGGYWCNYAAGIAKVADDLSLEIDFEDHGCSVGDLGQGGCRYQVAIWNLNDRSNPDEQDLLITNTTDRTFVFFMDGDRVRGELR